MLGTKYEGEYDAFGKGRFSIERKEGRKDERAIPMFQSREYTDRKLRNTAKDKINVDQTKFNSMPESPGPLL